MGPLNGIRVLELAGIGAAPFGCMLLADLGAEVVRVERDVPADSDAGRSGVDAEKYVPHRGRRSIELDLKSDSGRQTLLGLVDRADVLVEAYRPGVAERLGVGPDECLARNPRLVYARMTGWGQTGPLAHTAGHDINYIAVAGALDNFRRAGERPVPPLNLVADMGGGGMLMAFGIAAALVHVARTGEGQVVDAAMVDGAALQLATTYGMRAQGRFANPPGHNLSDTGAPQYEVYECADGKFVAVGALEDKFWARFMELLDLPDGSMPPREDPDQWTRCKEVLTQVFRTRDRAHWAALFDGTDACVTPVLSLDEAPEHPHAVARSAFVEIGGTVQPAPAPRFSRTPADLPAAPPPRGADTRDVLRDWGFDADTITLQEGDCP
ncbi:CaiB/BaiF CoA transferase family protein [Mycolicibacterium sp. XJ1819]